MTMIGQLDEVEKQLEEMAASLPEVELVKSILQVSVRTNRKKKRGQPFKVDVFACANKLLHHIFAILRKGQPYQT